MSVIEIVVTGLLVLLCALVGLGVYVCAHAYDDLRNRINALCGQISSVANIVDITCSDAHQANNKMDAIIEWIEE